MIEISTRLRAFREAACRPVDAASLGAFRFLFGSLLVFAVVRSAAKGWIDKLYVAPAVHFPWEGFEWIRAWPSGWMHAHFALIGAAAALVAVGRCYRPAVFVLFLAFTWLELIDKALYLNHYYFVSAALLLLCALPASARGTVPAWTVWALRVQVGVVYVFAGAAKLQADWLFDAQPLRTWLPLHGDLPLAGPWLADIRVAYLMSWGGAVFDLSVVPLLCMRRTRVAAFGAVVVFHATTGLLFHIGVFPIVMIASATVFFEPSWPRRLRLPFLARAPADVPSYVPNRITALLVCLHLALQVTVPLRQHWQNGNRLWTERGFRFAWNVMLIEKTGLVEFIVTEPASGRTWNVDPRVHLTDLQVKSMSTQPDMIRQFARYLAERHGAAAGTAVEVRAESWASLNGRPSRRLVDPAVDLSRATSGGREWIRPLEGDR